VQEGRGPFREHHVRQHHGLHAALLNHPIQALLDGHPRDVTEIASKVTAKLPSLLDLCNLDTSRTRLSRSESAISQDRSPMTNWSSDLETARHM